MGTLPGTVLEGYNGPCWLQSLKKGSSLLGQALCLEPHN